MSNRPIRMTFPNCVPGHPSLPPGTYNIDGVDGEGRVINPRMVPGGGVLAALDAALLPWQRAVLRLHNHGDMLRGAWHWRQVRVPDTGWAEAEEKLKGIFTTLLTLGREYSVSVWRPMASDRVTPGDYRLALLTWGDYLDMTAEEIYDKMNRDYAPAERG